MALGLGHGTRDLACAATAMVAAGAGRVGAVGAVIASHDATCEASGPLSDGACESVDVLKGV